MKTVTLNGKTVLVTGSPGFIGANLVLRLLSEMSGGTVISFDNMNDYYDPKLKEYRLSLIESATKESAVNHIFIEGSIANKDLVEKIFTDSDWLPSETIPLPDKKTGMAILKDHQSISERMIEQGRARNKGCYVVSWAFIILIVIAIAFGLHAAGLF